MIKKNLWLILGVVAFITLIMSIYMSYKTGKTEYAPDFIFLRNLKSKLIV